jgi:nucleotide-binding universal stress UspA family protein
MARILVGVDGSEDSKAALRWALEEARDKGHGVRALYVYGFTEEHNPFLAVYTSFGSSSAATKSADQAQQWHSDRDEELRRAAAEHLASIVRSVRAETDGPKVDEVVIPSGRPARALLDQAGNCLTMAVGARGRGGFRGLRLGSVAEKCVRHAPCSVMVARAPR